MEGAALGFSYEPPSHVQPQKPLSRQWPSFMPVVRSLCCLSSSPRAVRVWPGLGGCLPGWWERQGACAPGQRGGRVQGPCRRRGGSGAMERQAPTFTSHRKLPHGRGAVLRGSELVLGPRACWILTASVSAAGSSSSQKATSLRCTMPLGGSGNSTRSSWTKPTLGRMMRPRASTGQMTPGEAWGGAGGNRYNQPLVGWGALGTLIAPQSFVLK